MTKQKSDSGCRAATTLVLYCEVFLSYPSARHRTSLRQLEKIKTIIEDRWEEVWKIVTTRDRSF